VRKEIAICVILICFLVSCTQIVYDTNGPVSREEFYARFGWALPLPRSAREVQARLESEGTQENTLYMKFRCDLGDLKSTIQQWAADPFYSTQRDVHPLSLKQSNYKGTAGSPEWWQPRRITSGYYMILPRLGGRGLRIWVDESASVAYLYDES
jgi:hypothetical protein